MELMSATALATMVDDLTKAIVEKAKPGMFVELTSTERVHSYKPNIGIEGLAGTVARYAEDDPRLADGNDPKEMLDLIALVEKLQKAKQAVSATERSIEDTILVTPTGSDCLSCAAPKEPAEVEKAVRSGKSAAKK